LIQIPSTLGGTQFLPRKISAILKLCYVPRLCVVRS
jgi:hypothetical protein